MPFKRLHRKGLCECCASPNKTLYRGATGDYGSGELKYCAECWRSASNIRPNAANPLQDRSDRYHAWLQTQPNGVAIAFAS